MVNPADVMADLVGSVRSHVSAQFGAELGRLHASMLAMQSTIVRADEMLDIIDR